MLYYLYVSLGHYWICLCSSAHDSPETIEVEINTRSSEGLILWQGVVSPDLGLILVLSSFQPLILILTFNPHHWLMSCVKAQVRVLHNIRCLRLHVIIKTSRGCVRHCIILWACLSVADRTKFLHVASLTHRPFSSGDQWRSQYAKGAC